jgi:nitrogen fixation/metabolism regulation signal transduction histidine kinase
MIFKSLYLTVIVRVLGILLNSFLISYCILSYSDLLILINLFVILALQILFMVKRLNQINYDLEYFFKAIRNNDTGVRFSNSKNKVYRGLYEQFEMLDKEVRDVKIENENRNQYFKVLVEHVGIGLMSFDENGKVSLFNTAAKELFNKPHMYRLHELEHIQAGLSDLLKDLNAGEQKLISLYRNGELKQISLKATELKMLDQQLKLVSLQDIRNELDERELDSWQKLIRVLTHEIMNSVSPINSTIATLMDLYIDPEKEKPIALQQMDEELVEDTVEGLGIIDERSKGMIDFVTRFRDLTLLPQPNFKQLDLSRKINAILKLMKDQLEETDIEVKVLKRADNFYVDADTGMIDQVLINLLTNAIHALKGRDRREIKIELSVNHQHKPYISITDSGCGIAKEYQSEIFVPFFTTKASGSGVGLSLSRQLMRLHGGSIRFTTEIDQFTCFIVQF